MCEFCKKIGIGLPGWDFMPKEEENIVPTGYAIEIRKIVNKNALVFTNSANEYGPGALDIQFCPICGRKLMGE